MSPLQSDNYKGMGFSASLASLCLTGTRYAVPESGPQIMAPNRPAQMPETSFDSSADRAVVERHPSKQKSRITNGSALLPGVDQRSAWVRRAQDVLSQHLADKPDATAAEQAIIRRAAVLIVELERLERQFALAGEADAYALDLYGRVAGNMRRLLEAVGLERRARDIGPTLGDLLREDLRQQREAASRVQEQRP